MTLFSQRKGFKPVKDTIQIDDIDSDLRNGLWNALTIFFWKQMDTDWLGNNKRIEFFLKKIWHNYFKQPIDTLNDYWPKTRNEIREHFFKCAWFEVYDFLEAVVNNYTDEDSSTTVKFMEFCNSILERELSAYRFINDKITQITSEVEIAEIEAAFESSKPLKPVQDHLKRALELFADRKSPDYRNSIKESISAVEAICKIIASDSKATLGQAIKKVEAKVEMHTALKSAFSNLYGYTNDADGIRHALLDEPHLDFEDAKFMLVSCAGFINYLVIKASKSGIKLK